ncbi:MAG TPA: phosphoenolpyruvate carboxylase [Streptosporangiaceae bacterium]
MRRDVRLLGDMLGETIRDDIGQDLLDDVEELRRAVIEARSKPIGDEIVDLVRSWTLDRAEQVARAFTVYFHLVNLAEEHQRIRILRERDTGEEPVRESLGAAAEPVRGHLDELRVHLVLTAHPTEARRRAVVGALRRISELLQVVDDDRQGAADRDEATRALREQIDLLWRTSQLRVKAMDPIDEVRTVMTAFDETLFRVVPSVYRELDRALSGDRSGAQPTEVPAFIRFGSWVGADRDGNPFVTAQVTRETAVIQADHALRALETATVRVGRSMTVHGAGLRVALDDARGAHPELLAELEARAPLEPFRAYLLYAAQRLAATRTRDADLAYKRPAEFVADLRVVQDALAAAGAVRQAYGELQNLIWQAETFGFHLAGLEVRQHSEVHARALAEPGSAQGEEVLATIRAIAWVQDRYGEQACHRYVVSFTRSAEDIAAVYELAGRATSRPPVLDVIPLFESAADLENAPDVLSAMLALPDVASRLAANGRRLEAMLGYSDSAKELGPASATLRLYQTQAKLAAWAREHDIRLTLFHGRGGALGRGGGPAGRAVLAQAPGSVAGSFKVTEQGEVIFARYGQPAIAKRHLEQVSSAVILTSFSSEQAVDHSLPYAATATVVDDAARASFRRLVDAGGFASWFARISPLGEIGGLRIGSRPAKRGLGSADPLDLADLRAIPWVFAWSQTRLNLPGWYGLGSGLAAVGDVAVLRDVYRSWPLFRSLVDNAEMSLAKTDRWIASRYLALGGREDLTAEVLAEYDLTRRLVLEVTGHDRLLADRPVLSRAVTLRDPYVDALSYLQLRALAALRSDSVPEDREQLERLLLLSVNGVAAGLQNTGLCAHIGLSLTTRHRASGTRRCSTRVRTVSCSTARPSIRAAAGSRRTTGCCSGAACRPGSSALARAMTCT